MTENKSPRPMAMPRINTRIKSEHQKFIKAEAKKTKKTEGEVFRAILDKHIGLNPKEL